MEKFYLKVNILMIREKDMENIMMKMGHIIQGNLEMVYSMEKELNIIQMEKLSMKGILLMIKKKGMENIFGKMVHIIQANGKII